MTAKILLGHVLAKLKELPAESVHMVWTSPPYYGLRSYGTEPQVWGGDPACDHEWGDDQFPDKRGVQIGKAASSDGRGQSRGCWCQKCGAWRGEHGLEPSFHLWLQHEVEIFREVRRVLRSDGTLWLNCGDAYASAPNGRSAEDTKELGGDDRAFRDKPVSTVGGVFKPKDRMMMPHRLAIALQDDGWWVRDEIIWRKPNPMPSSVRDRTTPAHEMLFLLSKKARYYFDQFAIMEPCSESTHSRLAQATVMQQKGGQKQDAYEANGINERAGSRRPNEIVQSLAKKQDQLGKRQYTGFNERYFGQGVNPKAQEDRAVNGAQNASFTESRGNGVTLTRNKRSVWDIVLEPFAGAHFATAPTQLVQPCIQAGTSEKGVCPHCAAPWKRIVDRSGGTIGEAWHDHADNLGMGAILDSDSRARANDGTYKVESRGWYPSCSCDGLPALPAYPKEPADEAGDEAQQAWKAACAEVDQQRAALFEKASGLTVVPATVLDPFFGAGTTGLVADNLGRNAIGIELNPVYAKIARKRLRENLGRVNSELPEDRPDDLPLFAEVG